MTYVSDGVSTDVVMVAWNTCRVFNESYLQLIWVSVSGRQIENEKSSNRNQLFNGWFCAAINR